MPLTVDLTGLPDPVVQQVKNLVQKAREKQSGQPPPAVNGSVVEGSFPQFISDPNPTPEEFRILLDRMASRGTGQTLPHDFSRADIYDDHD